MGILNIIQIILLIISTYLLIRIFREDNPSKKHQAELIITLIINIIVVITTLL